MQPFDVIRAINDALPRTAAAAMHREFAFGRRLAVYQVETFLPKVIRVQKQYLNTLFATHASGAPQDGDAEIHQKSQLLSFEWNQAAYAYGRSINALLEYTPGEREEKTAMRMRPDVLRFHTTINNEAVAGMNALAIATYNALRHGLNHNLLGITPKGSVADLTPIQSDNYDMVTMDMFALVQPPGEIRWRAERLGLKSPQHG